MTALGLSRTPHLAPGALLAAYLPAWLYGALLFVGVLARRVRWTPERATALFLWLSILVVSVETALILIQVGEYQRVRFPLDPAAAGIVALALLAALRAAHVPVRLPARRPAAG